MSKQKQRHLETTLSLSHLTVDEALAAMLKTPPPPKAEKPKRKAKGKKGR